MLHGVPTDLAHLKVFGCTAYLRLEDRYMDKLSPKALQCMFIGYYGGGPGYWLLNLATGKPVRTIHVAFVESQPAHAPPTPSVPFGTSQVSPPNGLEHGGGTNANLSCVNPTHFTVLISNPSTVLQDTAKDDNHSHDPPADTDHVDRESSSCFAVSAYVQRTNKTARVFTHNKPPRPPRTIAQAARQEGQHAESEEPTTYPPAAHIPVPIDIKHALSGKYVVAWRKAIRSKLTSLHNKGTFRKENLPLGRNGIGNKWVFKVKTKLDGSVDRFTARLAAQEFSQPAGIDYIETFSPVVNLSTLRTVLAIAAKRNMHMHSAYIETAFFNANLQEDIYMRQPRGAEDETPRVMRLLKSIYGLKQAMREWYKLFHQTLSSLGLKRATSDTSFYTMNHSVHAICIVLVYVDDILSVSDSL
jgi:hypothetical protein